MFFFLLKLLGRLDLNFPKTLPKSSAHLTLFTLCLTHLTGAEGSSKACAKPGRASWPLGAWDHPMTDPWEKNWTMTGFQGKQADSLGDLKNKPWLFYHLGD